MTSPHPPDDWPPPQGDGPEAIRRAEDALVKQHSAVAMMDLHVVSAVMSAHSTTAEGRRALAALQREIESSVADRTDLDTPAGARDFQRYLIGKLRQIGSVVEAAGLDATSKAAMASAWSALYEAATRNAAERPAGDTEGSDRAGTDAEPKGGQDPGGPREPGSAAGQPAATTPPGASTSEPPNPSAAPQPAGVSSAPTEAGDAFGSADWPMEDGGYEAWDPAYTPTATAPASSAPAGSMPASSTPASSVPLSLPSLSSTPSSATDPFASSYPDLAGYEQDPYEDLLNGLDEHDELDELDELDDNDPGGDDPEDDDPAEDEDEEPTEEPTRTVTLPDGDTVTAPTPQIAAALTAALSGTPVEDALRQQGLTAAQPGVAPAHPLDPGKLSTGDIGVFTDRLAIALDSDRAWYDGQIQPVATVSGPSFLGWQQLRTDQPAVEAPQTPAPTRPAA